MSTLLYQLHHPWHWLTYGQNATALGIFMAAGLNLFTVFVLYRTLQAVDRQAKAADQQVKAAEEQVKAADRQARAAEKQVESAIAATAVSEAQRKATEESAQAEREHSDLIRQQYQLRQMPIVVLIREIHSGSSGYSVFRLHNQGEGAAFSVNAYRIVPGSEVQPIGTEVDIIGPLQKANLLMGNDGMNYNDLQVNYISNDGRFFVTRVAASLNGSYRQRTYETNSQWERIGSLLEQGE